MTHAQKLSGRHWQRQRLGAAVASHDEAMAAQVRAQAFQAWRAEQASHTVLPVDVYMARNIDGYRYHT